MTCVESVLSCSLLKTSEHAAYRFGPGNSESHARYWTGASSIDKVHAASRQGNTAPAKNSCTGEASFSTKSEVAYGDIAGAPGVAAFTAAV